MSDTKSQDIERIRKALDILGEHFDAVHIFASRHEETEGGTVSCNKGMGNFFARYGQISVWLEIEKSQCLREGSEPD